MPTILTLNINYDGEKHGPWHVRRRLISDTLRRSGADVAALQAVKRRGEGPDQATELAETGGYGEHYFCAAENGSKGALGSAFLSRVPIEEVRFLGLAPAAGSEDPVWRVVLHASFRWPGGSVRVFNAHFSWIGSQAREQMEKVVPFLRMFHGPSLLVGDFNMTPDSELLDPLRGAGWVDVWRKLRAGEDGFTYESNAPDRRIDYAWASPAMEPLLEDIRVYGAQALLPSPIGAAAGSGQESASRPRWAAEARRRGGIAHLSDHLGLAVRFSLPR